MTDVDARAVALHSLGVARKCREVAGLLGWDESRQNAAYPMGWLHDMAKGLTGFEDHGPRTARIVDGELSLPMSQCQGREITSAIRDHGTGAGDSPWLDVLNYADMCVDSEGNEVGFELRLRDIAERHGKNSAVYATCEQLVEKCRRLDVAMAEIPNAHRRNHAGDTQRVSSLGT